MPKVVSQVSGGGGNQRWMAGPSPEEGKNDKLGFRDEMEQRGGDKQKTEEIVRMQKTSTKEN